MNELYTNPEPKTLSLKFMEFDDDYFPVIEGLLKMRESIMSVDLEGNYFSDKTIPALC
jgi:Ran GTPase-activating protein (RanGAP) involved in mRNA processing and transport